MAEVFFYDFPLIFQITVNINKFDYENSFSLS